MAFTDELSAFRAYAESFPDHCVLLVDTYDTLSSGLPNSLVVARELRAAGHELIGVRLDSGDLAYLSRQARRMFDDAGFPDVKIVASNELDEYVINSIRSEKGLIDVYGVGTRLATCAGPGGGALGGVYKLVEFAGKPRMKVTSDPVKSTLPGCKRWLRAKDGDGRLVMDVLDLDDDGGEPFAAGQVVYDPANPLRSKTVAAECQVVDCRSVVMENGQILQPAPSLMEMADYCEAQLKCLPEGSLRLINPHVYKVGISKRLLDLREKLQREHPC
jgi:nicotinate phosphoribosyltransferase